MINSDIKLDLKGEVLQDVIQIAKNKLFTLVSDPKVVYRLLDGTGCPHLNTEDGDEYQKFVAAVVGGQYGTDTTKVICGSERIIFVKTLVKSAVVESIRLCNLAYGKFIFRERDPEGIWGYYIPLYSDSDKVICGKLSYSDGSPLSGINTCDLHMNMITVAELVTFDSDMVTNPVLNCITEFSIQPGI